MSSIPATCIVAVVLACLLSSASSLLIRDEFDQYETSGPDSWKKQLQSLDDKSSGLIANFIGRVDPNWTAEKGSKNRYATTQPYAENRVKLSPFPGEVSSEDRKLALRNPRIVIPRGTTQIFTDDYINASELNLPKSQRWYIITQAPLNSTVTDFWRMVYQQNVKTIVMLCHREGSSCATDYWPTPTTPVLNNGPLQATLMNHESLPDVIVSKIQLGSPTNDTSLTSTKLVPLNITHYHYLGWKDMQIPEMQSFLNLLRLVQPALKDTTSPTIVHCTAGVGRSGTFVLIDSILGAIENGFEVSIPQQLDNLRRLRYGLVETPEQLRFTYEAVMAAGEAAPAA